MLPASFSSLLTCCMMYILSRLPDLRKHFFEKDTRNAKMNDDPSVAIGTLDFNYYVGETAVDHVWQLQ